MSKTIVIIFLVIYRVLMSVICSNKETAVHQGKMDIICRSYQFDFMDHSPEMSSLLCSIKAGWNFEAYHICTIATELHGGLV